MNKLINLLLLLLVIEGKSQQLLFEKSYGYLISKSIIQGMDTTENGGYICEASQKFNNYIDVTFPGVYLKLNSNGDTVWMQTMQKQVYQWNYSSIKYIDKNKGYFSSANWDKTNSLSDTAWLHVDFLKYDGSIKWSNRFPVKDKDRTAFIPSSMIQLTDNRLLYFGVSLNSISTLPGNGHKYTVQVIDTSGNWITDKVYFTGDWVYTLEKSSNITKYGNNLVMYGFGGTTLYDKPYIVKINSNLDTIATKTLYPSPTNTEVFSPKTGNLIYTKDNSFVFSGSWNKGFPTDRSILMKTDTSGNPQWMIKMGPPNTNTNRIFELTHDTILLVTPETNSNNIWLFKITGNGVITDSTVIESQYTLGELRGAVLKWDGSLTLCGQADNTAWLAHITNAGRIKPICDVAGYAANANFTASQIKDTLRLSVFPNQISITGYSWQIGTVTSTLPNPKITITEPDSISIKLKVTNAVGCTDSIFKKIRVTCSGVNCIPANCRSAANFTYEVYKDTLYLSPIDKGNTFTHQWTISGMPIDYIAAVKYPLSKTEIKKDSLELRLIVTNPKGCKDTLTRMILVSEISDGIQAQSSKISSQLIKVFPNPNNGSFTIQLKESNKLSLTIINAQGNQLWQGNTDETGKAEITGLASGLYLVICQNQKVKVIVE